MNLTRIRTMIHEGDMSKEALRYLLRCNGECEYLDFKQELKLGLDYDLANFGKDVIAMKNTGGGYIVVGVQDKTWTPLGLSQSLGFDTKLLRDKVRKATGLDIDVDLVEHNLFLDNGASAIFVLILIRASAKLNKRRTPSLCKVDFHPRENWGTRRGEIYFRKGDSTTKVTSDDELTELIDDLDNKHSQQDIENAEHYASPFSVEHGLYRLLPADYEAFIGRESLKKEILEAIERDPRIWIINLHGPGGVGKTALATQIAYYYYRDATDVFESVLFLSAKNTKLTPHEIIRIEPSLYSIENLINNILVLFQHSEYREKPLDVRKSVVIEILEAYKMLLVLDNMETVEDGRIMRFIQDLPPSNQSKVLLTSRRRTSGWEYPIQINELSLQEVEDFVRIRSTEMSLDNSITDPANIRIIEEATGGLPLAIQWTLGRYSVTRDLTQVISNATSSDSPLLEFSFRNSWDILDEDSRQALAILSIFDEPPTLQVWRTAMDWAVDRLDRAIDVLQNVTFIYQVTDEKTGSITYWALPITLTFSRNMLATMGNLERQCRTRYQEHLQSMQLVAQETERYQHLFETFVAQTENEKKAIILCQKAEAQEVLGPEAVEQYYQQALDIEPRSVYTLVKYGRFLVSIDRIGEGIALLKKAAARCNNATGFFTYYNFALAYDSLRYRQECADALQKALEFNPRHVHARHMLGVTLSRLGDSERAIKIFDDLIDEQLSQPGGPTITLVLTYKTKVIALNKSGRDSDAQACLQEGIMLATRYPATKERRWELEQLKLDY
ncbi:MAG: tetratricopeptide repeat protein [Anaerolineae bacterium]|nr:tetratricopeptide repeat protein [Anaerolineae bacterium]